MLLYDQWYFHIGEWLLFITCVFHCFNGLRIIAVDFFDLTRAQKALLFWSVGITAVLAGFAALFFFPALRQMIFIS
jgi:succinate dehydrogenase/fumarate reductase cytochrome b subunit